MENPNTPDLTEVRALKRLERSVVFMIERLSRRIESSGIRHNVATKLSQFKTFCVKHTDARHVSRPYMTFFVLLGALLLYVTVYITTAVVASSVNRDFGFAAENPFDTPIFPQSGLVNDNYEMSPFHSTFSYADTMPVKRQMRIYDNRPVGLSSWSVGPLAIATTFFLNVIVWGFDSNLKIFNFV